MKKRDDLINIITGGIAGGALLFTLTSNPKQLNAQHMPSESIKKNYQAIPEKINYTVKKNDNLTEIANMFGIKEWKSLYNYNKEEIGKNPNLIFPEQVLTINSPKRIPDRYAINKRGFAVPSEQIKKSKESSQKHAPTIIIDKSEKEKKEEEIERKSKIKPKTKKHEKEKTKTIVFDELNLTGSLQPNNINNDISSNISFIIGGKYSNNKGEIEHKANTGAKLIFSGGSGPYDDYRIQLQKTAKPIELDDFYLIPIGEIGIGAEKIDFNEKRLNTPVYEFKGNPEDNNKSFIYGFHNAFGNIGLGFNLKKDNFYLDMIFRSKLVNLGVFPKEGTDWNFENDIFTINTSYKINENFGLVGKLLKDPLNNDKKAFLGAETNIFGPVIGFGYGIATDSGNDHYNAFFGSIKIKK